MAAPAKMGSGSITRGQMGQHIKGPAACRYSACWAISDCRSGTGADALQAAQYISHYLHCCACLPAGPTYVLGPLVLHAAELIGGAYVWTQPWHQSQSAAAWPGRRGLPAVPG